MKMNSEMKFLAVAAVLLAAGRLSAIESAKIRVDTRLGVMDGKIATGVEAIGEPDGSAVSSWVTTNKVAGIREYNDGWHVRRVDEFGLKDWFPIQDGETPDHDVLLLNDPIVIGGRLATNEVWTTGTVRVVRHNVVIPAGVKLTVEPESPVKFTENARIVIEEGGQWVAKGAWFAEITDDAWVDGDTNMDGGNSVPTGTQDWIRGMDPADYVHVMMLDGVEQVFPTRTYTRGEVYGSLPTLDRYEDGFFFRGWVTNQEETVGVAADQLAEMDQEALFANWEAIYLNLSTGLVEFAAYSVGQEREVGVASNDRWKYSCDADWLTVEKRTETTEGTETTAGGKHDGSLKITAEQNRNELPRSATLTISRENGKLVREVNVVQAAMERVAMPQIFTADGGTTFSDYMVQVKISCATAGVAIYYTTDESEPSAENGIRLETYSTGTGVEGIINLYNSATVKAIAVREDMLDSNVTTVRLVREATLAEAMDAPELFVSSDGDATWKVVTDETSDGISAVRSGAMQTSTDRRKNSRLITYVEGQGVLTFRWKVSCERDLTGHCDWDYLVFIADGQPVKRIEGDHDWAEVSYNFTGSGAHVIQWLYTKNGGFADVNPGRDCAWIDQVVWSPTMFTGEEADAREIYVNPSWMMTVGLVGASATDAEMVQAAQQDDDGDGFTNEEEGILGTDPKDPNSRLQASIAEKDGVMQVEFSPENKNSGDYKLDYRVMGVSELGGNWKDVTDMSHEDREANGFKFFKINVKIQKK